MGKKTVRTESFSDKEEGGAELDTPAGDAMDIDSTSTPTGDPKKSLAEARAERAARRKQRREELALNGHSTTSSLASTPNPETEPVAPAKAAKKSKENKSDEKSTTKKSKQPEDEVEAEAPAANAAAPEAPATEAEAEAEALPFVIDVKPSKPAVANIETSDKAASERGTSAAPSKANDGEGLNRAARRRVEQIERHRGMIKKNLGIPAGSNERQEDVDKLLADWTAKFDEKAEARAARKKAKKQAIMDRAKAKKGKQQGRNVNDDRQKQIKKQKQKKALRARQEAGSETNQLL